MSPVKDIKRKIFFCIPGSNEWRNKFRDEVLEPAGLLPHCGEIAQVASPIGRDRNPEGRNFPEHYDINDHNREYLTQRFKDRTHGTLNRLQPMFGKFDFVMADYEPRTYDAQGRVLRHWMGEVARKGFTPQDIFFLDCLRNGTMQGSGGLPYIEYNLPHFFHNADFELEEFIAVSTYASHGIGNYAVWHGLYPSGRESLEYCYSDDLRERVTQGRDFLKPLGRRIIAGIHPRFFFGHNAVFHATVFGTLIKERADDVVVWMKMGERNSDGSFNESATQFMYNEYVARFEEIVPAMKLWLGEG